MVTILEKDLDNLFASFRKSKLIVSRPKYINITQEKNSWKISLTFTSDAYLKSSNYTSLKPLWKFLKEQIVSQTSLSWPVIWEIIREPKFSN